MLKRIKNIIHRIWETDVEIKKEKLWKQELEQYISSNYVEEPQKDEEITVTFLGSRKSIREDEELSDVCIEEELEEREIRCFLGEEESGLEFFGLFSAKEDELTDDDSDWIELSDEIPSGDELTLSIGTLSADKEVLISSDSFEYSDFLEESNFALQERIQHMSDTFQQYLFYLIDMRKMNNADVYKRALITKQLFSKIKKNPDYHPDKTTAMRLCVGAKLNLDETKDLLARAGYALSPCDKRDIIFSFFIEHNIFDMIEIDIALEEYGLPCFIE